MNPVRMSMPRTIAAILLAGLAGATPLSLVSGCARTPAPQRADAPTPGGAFDPAQPLAQAMRKETRHPSDVARKAPPPPGLDVASLEPIPSDGSPESIRARLPLDKALADVDQYFPKPTNAAPLDIPADDRRRAVILYARGRSMRLDGKYEAAISTLESAAKLDPDAAAPWREIGEARVAMGDRHGAAIAYSRAFDRDPEDIRTLEQLASLPSTEADDRQTAAILARLYTSGSGAEEDPALEYLVPARLGTALLNIGYVSAGVELLGQSINLPNRFDAPSNRAQDLASLYRRRGDLWTTIGDADMRLTKNEQALDAYANAARLPSLDPTGLLLRRVYAAMRLGRPAAAGSFLVERLATDDGRADDQLLSTFRYVAENSKLADELDDAILALQASLPENEQRLAGASIVRARAAVLPTDRAIEIERAYLAEHPADETVLSGLFQQLAAQGPDAALREAIALTATSPLRDEEYVGALLRAIPEPTKLLEAWDSLDEQTRATPPASLLHATLLSIAKRPAEADQALQQLLSEHPGYPPALIARVRLLEVLDRGPEADELLRTINPGADVDLAYAKALALSERNDTAGAERVVQSALAIAGPENPRRVDLLLLGARLGVANNDAKLAEQRYLDVLQADPANESAHAGLIQLYAKGAPLADDQKLVNQLAQLRDTNPSSRLLRTLRARDALTRGQYDLAERDLLDLTEAYPDDEQAINTLVQLWIQTGSQERAEQWLERQISRFPARNLYHILLAQTYLSESRDRDAAETLESWLQQYPGDLKVSQILEQIYEQRLGDKAAANRLRARRLENAGDSDATAAERAKIYLDLGKYDEFISAARQAIDYAKKNNRDITEWGDQLVASLYRLARRGGCPPEAAVEAQGLICDGIGGLNEDSYMERLEILTRTGAPTLADVNKAIERTIDQHPEAAVKAYRFSVLFLTSPLVLQETVSPDRPDAPQRALRPADHDETVSRFIVAAHLTDDAAKLPNLSPDEKATVLALQFQTVSSAVYAGVVSELPTAAAMGQRLVDAKNKDAILDAFSALTLVDQSTAKAPDPRRRSQIAESIGLVLSNIGNDAGADAYDELALRYDPDNQTVNNNYGYRLLERDDPAQLDRALTLIQRAYDADPQPPAHIVDSLGWARYKAGIVHDVLDKNGNVATPGAVTLLTRAIKLSQNPSNTELVKFELPILSAHLGDALWLAGDHEKAIETWRDTVRLGNEALADRDAEAALGSAIGELRDAVSDAQRKIDAATSDHAPPVAPTLRSVNQAGATADTVAAPSPDPQEAPPDGAPPPPGDDPRDAPANPG